MKPMLFQMRATKGLRPNPHPVPGDRLKTIILGGELVEKAMQDKMMVKK